MNELLIGRKFENLISFLSAIPKMAKLEYTACVYKWCCLCLGHLVPKIPAVSLSSTDKNDVGVDLSDIIESLQSYLLVSSSEQNLFTSIESF